MIPLYLLILQIPIIDNLLINFIMQSLSSTRKQLIR